MCAGGFQSGPALGTAVLKQPWGELMLCSIAVAGALIQLMRYSIYHAVRDLWELIPAWVLYPDCSGGLGLL